MAETKSMNWKPLDLESTILLKGIAILMIVTHNFMHEFPGPKENEFALDPDNLTLLLNVLSNHPENSIQALFSFLGHFGVQIFIFLSAYGLSKKFLPIESGYWRFILKRFQTIYPSFILAILLWAIIVGGWRYGLTGPLEILYLNAESLILKFTLLSNFIPGEALSPVGPWWFIAFIFQFYFAFPFLFSLYIRWGNLFLVALSMMGITFALLLNGQIGEVNIYVNLLGYLPEISLGMYLAKNDDFVLRMPAVVITLALSLFILGNIYQPIWHLNHISFLILLLAGLNVLLPVIKKNDLSKKILLFVGSISISLFLVNGFLRRPFIVIAEHFDNWLITIVTSLMFLLTSLVIAFVLSKIEHYLMAKIIPKKKVLAV
jgi:peptidoglycan/LPS O-acetylase OafA/YrhL